MKFDKVLILLFASLILSYPTITLAEEEEALSLEAALQIGMANNYNILISKTEAEMHENRYTRGYAGYLPRLDLTATPDFSIRNSSQEFIGETDPQVRSGAQAYGIYSAALLEWTFFNGFRTSVNFQRLGTLSEMGQLQAKAVIEQSIADITLAYYNVVKLQKMQDVLSNSIEISEKRKEIAERAYEVGSVSRTDLLQATADLNAERSRYLQQSSELRSARLHLNELLARDVNTNFSVTDSIAYHTDLEYADLNEKIAVANRDLELARKNRAIAELEHEHYKGNRYPSLSLHAGYDYNFSESESGFMVSNRIYGPTVGLTARINLFDGFRNRVDIENARLDIENSHHRLNATEKAVNSYFASLYVAYDHNLSIVEMENENIELVRENVDVATRSYELGLIDGIALREAQNSLVDAESRLIEAQYAVKQAETRLLQLSGGFSEE